MIIKICQVLENAISDSEVVIVFAPLRIIETINSAQLKAQELRRKTL